MQNYSCFCPMDSKQTVISFQKTTWSRGAQAGVLAVFGQVGVVLQKDLSPPTCKC